MADKNALKAVMIPHAVAAADSTGKLGVYRIAITGGNQSISGVPATWHGRFFRITNDSSFDLQYAFSSGAVTLVNDQASAIGTGSGVAGSTIFAGGFKDARVPHVNLAGSPINYFNFVTPASSTGFVELECSETQV